MLAFLVFYSFFLDVPDFVFQKFSSFFRVDRRLFSLNLRFLLLFLYLMLLFFLLLVFFLLLLLLLLFCFFYYFSNSLHFFFFFFNCF